MYLWNLCTFVGQLLGWWVADGGAQWKGVHTQNREFRHQGRWWWVWRGTVGCTEAACMGGQQWKGVHTQNSELRQQGRWWWEGTVGCTEAACMGGQQ